MNAANGLADAGTGFAVSFRPFRFFRGQFETLKNDEKSEPQMNMKRDEFFCFYSRLLASIRGSSPL